MKSGMSEVVFQSVLFIYKCDVIIFIVAMTFFFQVSRLAIPGRAETRCSERRMFYSRKNYDYNY